MSYIKKLLEETVGGEVTEISRESMNEYWDRAEMKRRKEEKHKARKPICKWCKSDNTRPLVDNGIKGPGYAVKEWVCNNCGAVQPKRGS